MKGREQNQTVKQRNQYYLQIPEIESSDLANRKEYDNIRNRKRKIKENDKNDTIRCLHLVRLRSSSSTSPIKLHTNVRLAYTNRIESKSNSMHLYS